MVIHAENETEKRTHSKMLMGWLAVLAVLYGYLGAVSLSVWLNLVQRQDPTINGGSEGALVAVIALCAVNVVATLAMWKRRKAGYYALVVTAIPMALLNLLFHVSPLMALFPVYSAATTWTLIQKQWAAFY